MHLRSNDPRLCSPFVMLLRRLWAVPRVVAAPAAVAAAVRRLSLPADVTERLQLWDEEAERQRTDAAITAAPTPCAVRVAGSGDAEAVRMEAAVGEWTPAHAVKVLAADVSGPSAIVAATVNGEVWDLGRHLPADARGVVDVQLLPANSDQGRMVMWHSAAHVLGAAVEAEFGAAAQLTDGPPLRESDGGGGFFYELHLADGRALTPAEFPAVLKRTKKIIKSKKRFNRLQVDRATAERMFAGNRFKLAMLRSIPDGEPLSVYRCGDFVDLCRGPHVPHTGVFKGFSIVKTSASHFDDPDTGAANSVLLHRLYGMAFTSKEELTEWEELQREAQRRDHRVVGKAQQLFMFHDMSPGSAFMLPHGTRVYNKLIDVLRDEYRRQGYDEVMSPLLYKPELWKTSGHWDNYRDNMFMVSGGGGDDAAAAAADGDSQQFGLKPMNCPGHCLMFAARSTSYRDLPIRYADFSSLHRNEATGALGGLTRLRRFQQDDAHIFCRTDQMEAEVRGCLEFVHRIYSLFGFKFRFLLSTRPEKYMGDVETWNTAEAALATALTSCGHGFEVEEGEGAFYGPKIDVTVSDALKREHQCATIQLDFQLPNNFELEYNAADGSAQRPVMIHRAILGSVERMMAVLIEHFGGRWPFWLSPRQVMVCPVSPAHAAAADALFSRLHRAGLFVDVDASDRTVPKRIQQAQTKQYNMMAVIGNKEIDTDTVTVRFRDAATLRDAQAAAAAAAAAAATSATAAHDDKHDFTAVVRAALPADASAQPPTVTMPSVEFVALCDALQHPTLAS